MSSLVRPGGPGRPAPSRPGVVDLTDLRRAAAAPKDEAYAVEWQIEQPTPVGTVVHDVPAHASAE
jgi:hypothetical protein